MNPRRNIERKRRRQRRQKEWMSKAVRRRDMVAAMLLRTYRTLAEKSGLCDQFKVAFDKPLGFNAETTGAQFYNDHHTPDPS